MDDIHKNIINIYQNLMDIATKKEKVEKEYSEEEKIYLQNMKLIATVKIIEVNEDILHNNFLKAELKYLKKLLTANQAIKKNLLELKEAQTKLFKYL